MRERLPPNWRAAAAEYEKVAQECARGGVDHVRYLFRLCELELIERERRMVERRIRAARFPAVKGLDSFEFGAIPWLNKMLVLELSRSEYIPRRENPPSTRRPKSANSSSQCWRRSLSLNAA